MCRRREGIAAVTAAAEQLERACSSRFACEDLQDPATTKHLADSDELPSIEALLKQLGEVPSEPRTKH